MRKVLNQFRINAGGNTFQTFRRFHLLPTLALDEFGGGWCISTGWGRWGVRFWAELETPPTSFYRAHGSFKGKFPSFYLSPREDTLFVDFGSHVLRIGDGVL